MDRLGRSGDGAGDLTIDDLVGERRKGLGIVIPPLGLEAFPANRPSIQTRRRAGLQAAQSEALAQFGAKDGVVKSAELVVYAREGKPQLAWDVQVNGVREDGTPSRAHLLLSATSKTLLDRWDDIHTADDVGTGKTLYSGDVSLHDQLSSSTYTLKDSTRGNHYVVSMNNGTTTETTYTATDNIWGNNAESSTETVAADAAYGQNMTWDYYKTTFGRNGIANDGKGAYSRVHYSSNYDNAYWDDTCFCMTYGDGNTLNPLVSLDVAGHEMTHGVTSRSANLTYSGESGGLNEATSDIMGTMVEFYANNANSPANYLIGERIYKAALGVAQPTKALRYMFKPSLDGSSPDCYTSTIGSLDVHYSSGVANHFYYLLAEGAVVPSNFTSKVTQAGLVCNGNTAIKGIGRDAASKIWYRALTVYMTSSTNYAAARAATSSAATDLYGAGSPEAVAVATAWSAVRVN